MVDQPNIFYLIHLDEFINSNYVFFTKNPLENLKRTKEYQFVNSFINLFLKIKEDYLVFLKGSNKKNNFYLNDEICNTIFSGLDENFLFPTEARVFTIEDDLYRDSQLLKGNFESQIPYVFEEYRKEFKKDPMKANHFFSGYHSQDCVPHFIEVLSTGNSSHRDSLDGIITLNYEGPLIPSSNIKVISDLVWPEGKIGESRLDKKLIQYIRSNEL
jgi:hypothetical protein